MKYKSKKRIVISAAYGMGNLGDEAICDTIIKDILSINKNVILTVIVIDINKFFKSHPNLFNIKNIKIFEIAKNKKDYFSFKKIWWATNIITDIFYCDLFVWGGGGIVRNRPDWLSLYIIPLRIAKFFKKRIFVWSIGVNKISNKKVINLVNHIKDVDFISVRDKESKKSLEEILFNLRNNIYVINDPVFHFDSIDRKKNNHNELIIGLNLAFWKADLSDQKSVNDFINSLAYSLNKLSEIKQYTLYYLPTAQKKDDVLFEYLYQKLSKNINIEKHIVDTPQEFLDLSSKLDLFVCSRLHAIILASNVKDLPIIPIIYDEKVLNLSMFFKEDCFFSINDIIQKPEIFLNTILDAMDGSKKNVLDFSEFRSCSISIKEYLTPYII
jgi:polysaccharide pyruvyl transferase WcaK-like protein